MRTLVVLWLSLFCTSRVALACSAFMLRGADGPIVAKSYDWDEERGLVMVNVRGMQKRALTLAPEDKPAAWTSRYASVTFNQYGRELPNGGLNEAGLVVEVLMLPTSEFPPRDPRPVVSEAGFVQYLLDQAATLDEALRLAVEVRVAPAYAKIHYFVCDAQAACATLEFVSGRLVATHGSEMPVCAITNNSYAESQRALAAHEALAPLSSLGRFKRLAAAVAQPAQPDAVAQAWSLLDSVRSVASTQWQIVYEPTARRVHFRSRRHPSIKTVSLASFDHRCAAPTMIYDLLSDDTGKIDDRFVPYSEARNLALVRATLAPMRKQLPAGIAERVARFPSTLTCAR